MRTRYLCRAASFIAGVLLISATASAQYRAGIQGVVADPTGAVVPAAKITVTSKETNISRTTESSASGVYSLSGLAPGHYDISAEKPGFAKKVIENITVNAEQVQAVNIELSVSEAAQTVTVSATTVPALDTQNATISGTITAAQAESLPSFGRDPFRLLQLAPGAFGTNAISANGGSSNLPGNAGPGGTSASSSIFQTENQAQVVANGTRNTSNSFVLDGASVNSLNWGGAAVVTPNEESVKEIRIDSSSYTAENARAGGAQIMVVSKNGTNDLHGSVMGRWARPDWNAFQKWNGPTSAVQRVNDRFNQFGGSIGGPILRNKLFFFFSYETLRLNSVTTGSNWFETPQFLQTVQAAKPNSIAAKITGFPGEGASFSSISQSAGCAVAGISPCAEIRDNSGALAGLDIGSPLNTSLGTRDPTWVSGGASGSGGGLDGIPDIMFVNTVNPTRRTAQQYNGRIDFQATANDLIAVSIYMTPVNTKSFNGPARAANFWINDRLNHADTALWNHTFSPTVFNEARFSLSRWSWNEVDSNPQEPWGLPNVSIDSLNNAKVQNFGAPGPSIFAQNTYNVRDTLSWSRGSHLLKFGGDIYWEQNNSSRAWNARPSYSFRNLWDFANDAPYQENGTFDPRSGVPTPVQKYLRSGIYGFFVQDDWKVNANLTLNLGLRYEFFNPMSEKYGNLSNAVLGQGPNALTDLRMKLGGDLFGPSYNNFAPQVGFAWSPTRTNNRFVLRGGFGIGYTRTEGAILSDATGNAPFVSSASFLEQNIIYAVPEDVHQFYNWPANPNAVLAIDPATNLPRTGQIELTIVDQNMPTPTTYRYSLEGQYELGGSWVATLGYQGSQTRHYARKRNLNWEYPMNRNPALRNVFMYSDDGLAYYNAMLVSLRHRMSRSFEIEAQYRWSNTIDTGSNEYFIGQYPWDLAQLRGMSDFDVRHNFKLYGIWSPRIFPSNAWLERIAGGWQISGILNWNTGFPWTPVYTGTSGNAIYPDSGCCDLRPGAYLGGAGHDYSNDAFMRTNGNFPGGAFRYFTVPAFSSDGTIPPPPGVGRNSFRGPGYFNVDLSLQKSFGLPPMKVLGEAARIDFRADFFNIFNKLNLTNIATSIGSSPTSPNALFGQAQAGLAGRVINLQARFSF
jgi:hypothetical protein